MSETWMEQGRCREVDPDIFHPGEGAAGRSAYAAPRLVCNGCEVKQKCLEFALDNMHDDVLSGVYGFGLYGMWGGTTPQERHALLGSRLAAA